MIVMIGGLLLAVCAGPAAGQGSTGNPADEAAIKKAMASFLKAFAAGDARAVATHWTEHGEYLADDGTAYRGRAAIEAGYRELFGKKIVRKAETEDVSLRFPSRDTAIEDGHFKLQIGNQPPTSSKYSVLHVREDGRWLMAQVREWPSEGTALRDLEWLIGSWEAKRDGTLVQTTYEWWGDKAFIRVAITLKQKEQTNTGFQMIGKDASTGQLRSWTFDTEGSFGEATWSRDGKKWLQDSAGVTAEGSVLAATHILTRVDNDAFTFQSVRRSVDGEDIDDIPPIRVTRVKGK
jgi:uncharacterized protein (TIGR02246 family)